MGSLFQKDVRGLLVLAIGLSILLAQGQDEDELGKMAAFFTIIGDILALFALQPGLFAALADSGGDEAEP
jgi:hypothetical protein